MIYRLYRDEIRNLTSPIPVICGTYEMIKKSHTRTINPPPFDLANLKSLFPFLPPSLIVLIDALFPIAVDLGVGAEGGDCVGQHCIV